jgi:hypothetical protein
MLIVVKLLIENQGKIFNYVVLLSMQNYSL